MTESMQGLFAGSYIGQGLHLFAPVPLEVYSIDKAWEIKDLYANQHNHVSYYYRCCYTIKKSSVGVVNFLWTVSIIEEMLIE